MTTKKTPEVEKTTEKTVRKPRTTKKKAPVAVTYDSLVSKLSKKYNGKKTKINDYLTAQIRLFGEAEGIFYLEVQEGIVNIMPFDYVNADLNINISCENCMKILDKTFNYETAICDGSLAVYGDLGKMLALKSIL